MLSESRNNLQPLAHRRMVVKTIMEEVGGKTEKRKVLLVLEGSSAVLNLYVDKEDVGKYTYGDVLDVYVYSLPLIKG